MLYMNPQICFAIINSIYTVAYVSPAVIAWMNYFANVHVQELVTNWLPLMVSGPYCNSVSVYNWGIMNKFVAADIGISSRVCNVPQLLPWTAVWGGAWLHVPAAAVSHSLPHAESSVWLCFRLDNIETESRKFSRRLRQPANRCYCR